ncbi:MAG: methionine ABC transporter ATP-binding protein [Syntrophothermus sp.]
MIRIVNVTKVFESGGARVEALKGVSLEVAKGEIYGIIGLSGAGKSTLIRCINMLERPQSGSIYIGDQDVTLLGEKELRAARREIGMIFQHFNLLSSRTVFGNVAFPLEIAGVPRPEIRRRVTELLEMVGLAEKADAYPAQLSGGQKQRVGIARALANRPKVLLSDEATSALDPQTTASILELLRDINKRLGITIVLITHEMNVIKEICDTVAVIENGQIIERGPVREVFTNTRTKTAREFIKGVMQSEIPEEVRTHRLVLANRGFEGEIVRISFMGEAAGKPIISSLVREFDLDANILYGKIDHFKEIPFGMLVVELTGKNGTVKKGIDHLKALGLECEVLKHVEPAYLEYTG